MAVQWKPNPVLTGRRKPAGTPAGDQDKNQTGPDQDVALDKNQARKAKKGKK